MVSVFADGYTRQQVGSSPYGTADIMLPVEAGRPANTTFHLMPSGIVSGRVTDDAGKPVAGIALTLFHPTYSIGGRKNLSPMGSAPTNERGEYRLTDVMPGKYYLSTEASRLTTRMFYPGQTELDRAVAFEVQPGREVSAMDFRVSSQGSHTIRGRVVDSATGQSPINAIITIVSREQSFGSITSSSAPYDRDSGTFELLNVSPGAYWIRAQLPGGTVNPRAPSAARPAGITAVDVRDADVENVVVKIQPLISIQGRMRIEGTASTGSPNDGPFSIYLVPANSAPNFSMPTLPATVQADGTFRIDGINPGEYRVSIPGLSPLVGGNGGLRVFIKEARLGGTDLLTNPLHLSGPVLEELQVVLSRSPGDIHGIVRDDNQKVAGVSQIMLVPDNRDRLDLYKVTVTVSDGQFSIPAVPPGAYRILPFLPRMRIRFSIPIS